MEKEKNIINLNLIAHLGDAVYELFVREHVVHLKKKINVIHKITTLLVRAEFQAKMLLFLEPNLTEEEKEVTRRARNISLTHRKKNNQLIHRQATSFEVLIGYNHLYDKTRRDELFKIIEENDDFVNILQKN